MKLGVGFYIFDKDHKLLLCKKSSGLNEKRWLVPGATEKNPRIGKQIKKIDIGNVDKTERLGRKWLHEDVKVESGAIGTCDYVGVWFYEGGDERLLFHNFVVELRDNISVEKLLEQVNTEGENNIQKFKFFDLLLDLPKREELANPTADFFKALLFHKPSSIPSPLGQEGTQTFEKSLGEDSRGYFPYETAGRGGQSQVYKVLDICTLSPRVVKVAISPALDENWRDRFIREGSTLLTLPKSESFEEVFSINSVGDSRRYYLVKSLVKGKTLEDLLYQRDQKKWSPSDWIIVDIMKGIIKPLPMIHSRLICHRDLKPNNIIVQISNQDKVERLTIVDFGLCKSEDVRISTEDSFHPGNVVYQSPNIVQRYNNPQAMDDYYSTLQIFYELIHGKHFKYSMIYRRRVEQHKRSGKDEFLRQSVETIDINIPNREKSRVLFKKFHRLIREHYFGNRDNARKIEKKIQKLFC